MKLEKKERYLEIAFLVGIFVFTFCWALLQPLGSSPDEYMRYQISEYIVNHGRLPHGADPQLRNEFWGISYGFNPILPNMVSALFMKPFSFFTTNQRLWTMAGRMTNILCTVGTGWFVLRIGELSFSKRGKWLFALMLMLLPETLFLGSYMNNDAMALFACAWIFYLWVLAAKEGWNKRRCVGLGAAIAVCSLTYYNAYGFILCSIFFFAATILLCREKKWEIPELLKKGLLVSAVFFVLAGWWFIRSYILYDGDILGMRTSAYYSGLYAAEEFKPWNRQTPLRMGMSIKEMLLWVPESMRHNWLVTVWVSFIGTFGYMDVYKPFVLDKICALVFAVGIVTVLWHWKEIFFPKGCSVSVTREVKTKEKYEKEIITTKTIRRGKDWNAGNLLHLTLVIAGVIPVLLAIWYAYASDYQAQGRYVFSMALPLLYFVTLGYELLAKNALHSERAKRAVFFLPMLWSVFLALYSFFGVFYPAYSALW